MLTIRDGQMAVFRETARQRYEQRMLAYMRDTYPARHAALGDEGTVKLVQHGIEFAKRHTILGMGGVSVIIDLMARFGERFEDSGAADWINEMLARDSLPAEVRIESIIKHLTAVTGGRVVVAAEQAS